MQELRPGTVDQPVGDRRLGVTAQTAALEGMRDYLYSDPSDQTATLARDVPKDVPGGNAPNANTPVSLIAGASDGYGTLPNFCTAFLQRLANPMLPWNPLPGMTGHDNTKPVNPYLTVDWVRRRSNRPEFVVATVGFEGRLIQGVPMP